MEKVTVTGLLLAVVFALSMHSASASVELETPNTALVVADSLPPGKIHIKTDDDGERMEARIENRKLVYLRINDREIPEAELPGYENYVEKKLNETPPPPPAPGAPPAPPAPGVVPAPPAPGAPPAPPAPRLRSKTFTIETDEDGGTYFIADSVVLKGVNKMSFFNPEITYIRGNDTIVIIDPESPVSLEELDRLMERQRREMEKRQIEIEVRARDMEHRARDLQEKAMEMERLYELRIEPGMPDMPQVLPLAGRGNAKTALENELLRDGLITNRTKYKMELSAGSLKVNGKKMPEGLARKYRQLYAERSGISLEKGGKVVIEK